MSNMNRKHMLGIAAFGMACVLAGSGLTMAVRPAAVAENTTTVVTSPFTEAISAVHNSVVGVNNYQTVRYSNGSNFDRFFGFGFGFGYGYGDDYGNRGNGGSTQEVKTAAGSGVVIAKGYVLTNNHVVDGATSLKIAADITDDDVDTPVEYDAVLVANDANLDIAILYAPQLPLQPVELGDSDTLQVGDWAICIGNPLNDRFYGTVTTGIVSGINREVSSSNYDRYGRRETITNTMIQTDAAINNGNSGGGMFSVDGKLMGIPTLKYSGSAYSSSASIEGIGMCIPINAAKPLIEDVLNGKIETPEVEASSASNAQSTNNDMIGKPRLGVTISAINTNSTAYMTGAIPNGVYVQSVDPDSPAEVGGMKSGDIIVEADGTVITGVSQLQGIIAERKEGDTLKIKVFRLENPDVQDVNQLKGDYVDLEVTLKIIDAVKQ